MTLPLDITNKKVAVVGMGRSGLAAAQLLVRHGARPFVTESASGEAFASACAALKAMDLPHESGGHTAAAWKDAELVVLSPGVPAASRVLDPVRAAGIPVVAELELASWFCAAKLHAVTGTNGKTTVTELLRTVLADAGVSVALAGNNDCPLSEVVLWSGQPEVVVLEVSSYQLETCHTLRPAVVAVLNLTEDHLGRHKTMAAYAEMKASLCKNQGAGDIAVFNADDQHTSAMNAPDGVRRCTFSLDTPQSDGVWIDGETLRFGEEALAQVADVALPGRHNLANVLAVLTMARAGGFRLDSLPESLRTFPGVEHRIERVVQRGGATYYNDSKSTNTDSLRVALESFDSPVVLIAGGQGKGGGYEGLTALVARGVRRAIVIGEDGPKMAEAWAAATEVVVMETVEEAVEHAGQHAQPGDVVLFSPGCASFDQFRNFEERGRRFKACVRQLEHAPA